MTTHVSNEKKAIVAEFTKLMTEYPIIGLVNMQDLPAKQLQRMREQLRGQVLIRMTKGRLIKVAFDQCEGKVQGAKELKGYMRGMPAMIFTRDNPFKLFKILKKNKSTTFAKGGQIAPHDIIVPAGPTPFAPGPIIGELGSIGIKTGIDAGKVAIKQDSVVVKEGGVISAKVAGLLTRLGIEPMEVGLDLVAVLENGSIMTKTVLDVDEDAIRADIECAAQQAFNLAVDIAYPCDATIQLLISKAFRESKAVASEIGYISKDTIGDILARATREGIAINELIK